MKSEQRFQDAILLTKVILLSLSGAPERLGIALLGGGYLPAVTITPGRIARAKTCKRCKLPVLGRGVWERSTEHIPVEGKRLELLVVVFPAAVVKILS